MLHLVLKTINLENMKDFKNRIRKMKIRTEERIINLELKIIDLLITNIDLEYATAITF